MQKKKAQIVAEKFNRMQEMKRPVGRPPDTPPMLKQTSSLDVEPKVTLLLTINGELSRLKNEGDRAFSAAAPNLWNSSPFQK